MIDTREYTKIFQEVYDMVKPILGQKKALLWMHTENLNLGGAKPYQMILNGRVDKLKAYIITQSEENIR